MPKTFVVHPQPGDWAWHIDGKLDARRVTKVIENPATGDGSVYLDLGGEEYGPFPIENYTYERGER